MKKLALGLCLIAALALGACSQQSAQSALEPKTSSCSPLNSTAQFYVGTANVAGVMGINTLVTLRQNAAANCTAGASLLVDAPTITGPAGFTVPAVTDAGGDAGTNKISGSIVTSLLAPPPATTFDNSTTGYGLATGYGFMPSIQQTSLAGPSFQPYALPFYVATAAKLSYIGGPPAFVPPADSGGTHTSTRDGTFPPGYLGYVLGFVDFQAAPVAGSYGLSISIPTGQNLQSGASSYGTETATASITNAAALGAATWAAAPTFVSDGTGGGVISTNFVGGAGLTEEYIELVDVGPGTSGSACTTNPLSVSYPIYYTFKVAPGTATVTVPDNIGPAQPGKTQGHTLCTAADNGGAGGPGGDALSIYGFAVDYSLFSSAYPQSNGNPAPTITTNAGQADVTTSPANTTATE